MRMIIPALAALALASPVMAQDEAAQDDAPEFAALVSVTYECERGVELPVVYINQQDGPGHVVALIEGRMMTLPQVISASGARYRADGDQAYEFWSKGDMAFVYYGDESEPRQLLGECVAGEAVTEG